VITVQDVTDPVLTIPANVTVECSAVPTVGTATATDNCDADVTVTYEGEVRTDGTCADSYLLTRTWKAVDNCGNETTASQVIRVLDTTPPLITVQAADLTVECDGSGNTTQLNNWLNSHGGASATDNCGNVTWRDNYVQMSNLCGATGSATVLFSALDDCGNISTTTATFTIVDDMPPQITCPGSITVNNDPGLCGAEVDIPIPVFSEICGSATLRNDFNSTADASGFYPTGTTSITWYVTDECGNSASCQMTVLVIDIEKPVISCPPDLQVCIGESVNLGEASAIDNCGIASVTNNAPETYPVGTTIITWVATDLNGMTSSCQQNVIVVPMATANAGQDITICAPDSIIIAGATASNYSSIIWTSTGTGNFTDPGLLNPVYKPSQQDVENGSVMLTIHVQGNGACAGSEDDVKVTFGKAPEVFAGDDAEICFGSSFTVSNSWAHNYSSISWSLIPPGAGTLINPESLNPTFAPAVNFSGTVGLILTVNGSAECNMQQISDELTLNVFPQFIVDAGPDQLVPEGTATYLDGTVSPASSSYTWHWEPSDKLEDAGVAAPHTLPINESTLFSLTIMDLMSGCMQSDSVLVIAGNRLIQPVAVVDYDTTDIGTPVTIPVLANDTVQPEMTIHMSIYQFPQNGTVVINQDMTITYTPYPRFSGNDTFSYQICDEHSTPLCDTALVNVYIKPDGISIIDPTSGITPNDDGKNDVWIIRGIEDYPDNEVLIFNRWGDIIDSFAGYDNKDVSWKGNNKNNERVPDGTYYYIIKIKDYGTLAGWIFVRNSD
jgi:gliding motility-associated-like protein